LGTTGAVVRSHSQKGCSQSRPTDRRDKRRYSLKGEGRQRHHPANLAYRTSCKFSDAIGITVPPSLPQRYSEGQKQAETSKGTEHDYSREPRQSNQTPGSARCKGASMKRRGQPRSQCEHVDPRNGYRCLSEAWKPGERLCAMHDRLELLAEKHIRKETPADERRKHEQRSQ